MPEHNKRDWRELCKAAMKEEDPEKLLDLVKQINDTLSQLDVARAGVYDDAQQHQPRDPDGQG